jgi:hypothetical protein
MDSSKQAIDSELFNVLIRLMTPFRRQFQQTLDVNRFLLDPRYAREVVDGLMGSDDPRILDACHFLRARVQFDRPVQTKVDADKTEHSVSSTMTVDSENAPDAATTPTTPSPPAPPATQDVVAVKYVKRLR